MAARRYLRTLVLGVAATLALVWSAIRHFGVAPREMAELLLAALLVVVITILLAALAAGLWVLLRRLFRGRDSPP